LCRIRDVQFPSGVLGEIDGYALAPARFRVRNGALANEMV
jgi:hypothetical protein